MAAPVDPPASPTLPTDPAELLRSRSYMVILGFSALLGVPVAIVAYFFLKVVGEVQQWIFTTLPVDLGFDSMPAWWPLPILTLAGVGVALSLRYLPGPGGHPPAQGLVAMGSPEPIELPGIFVAAFITLALGVVLGPEAPLIAIGGGLGVLAIRLLKKDAPQQAVMVIGAAGSFAAVSTLLGSPLVGAFLLMEAAGLGGPLLGVLLVPGLLAAGIGALVFLGLDNLTGFGTFSLAVPDLPTFSGVTIAMILWAVLVGILASVLGSLIRFGGLWLQPRVDARRLVLTPLLGLGVGVAAVIFTHFSDHSAQDVLFSGQDALGPLIQSAETWSVGALVLLIVCKGVAYSLSLSAFRGGPTFPAMFIGAAGGMALSHAAGLPMIAGVAMGIGAMAVTMLGLPLTSVLLTAAFLAADGVQLMPLIIVSVVVAYVMTAHVHPRLTPRWFLAAQASAAAPVPAAPDPA